MGEHGVTIESYFWISDENFANEVLGFFGDILPGLNFKIVLARLDLFEKGEIVLLVERWSS